MKKIFAVLVLIGLFSIPTAANATTAGFFNNGLPYMESDMWSQVPGDDSDPLNVDSAMTEVDSRLEWTVATHGSWPAGEEAWKGYASEWVLDLSTDFTVSLEFHYDPASTTSSAGMELGFYYFDEEPGPGIDPYYTGISVEHFNNGSGTSNEYTSEFAFGGTNEDNDWTRGATDGTLTALYSANTGNGTITFIDGEGAGSATYSNLRAYNSYVSVALGGFSNGDTIDTGEAYFENLLVSGDIGAPPVVPEPISSTLFLIGGATLGFRRFRKSIKN